jgi:hypothetical protein
MTEKEIAKRLREIANYDKPPHRVTKRELNELADTLDPPRPKLGTVVLFRPRTHDEWQYGIAASDGIHNHTYGAWRWDACEWREVPVPDSDGYCVVDGKLHKLVGVPRAGNTHLGGQFTYYLDPAELERKEQEYGL